MMKMVKIVLVTVVLAFILPWAEPAFARYNIVKLHSGVYSDDYFPTINNRGEIVFFHQGCQFTVGEWPDTSIYTEEGAYQLYRNGLLSTLNVPPNDSYPYNYAHPPFILMNDLGQLGYRIEDYNDGGKYKIYFHNGAGTAPQLLSSTASWQGNVQLNQKGQMAWTNNDAEGDLQVYLFANGTTNPITTYRYPSVMNANVSMNDNGQLVWIDRTESEGEYWNNIRQYQNGVTSNPYSTTKEFFGSQIQINNLGQIVWAESNGSDIEVMLYNGGSAQPIPDGGGFSQLTGLQINQRGQIMWLGLKDGTEYDIYLYSNGVTRKITNYQNYPAGTLDIWQNSLSDVKSKFSPQMNNKGEIVWITRVPNASTPSYYDMALYVYSRGRITKLDGWTVNPYSSSVWAIYYAMHAAWAQINDAGQVVWSRYSGPVEPVDKSGRFQIYLATPPKQAGLLQLLLSD